MKNTFFKKVEHSSAKIAVKVAVLVVMTLLLWIPLAIIERITWEREGREKEVQGKIATEVGGEANTLTFHLVARLYNKSDNPIYYVAPDQLDIRTDLKHQCLKQGRFDILTYAGDIQFKAQASLEKLLMETKLNGVIDTSALSFYVKCGSKTVFYAEVSMDPITQRVNIDGSFTLRGTKSITFRVPRSGTVAITGDWSTPDFSSAGTLSPVSREVTKDGFTVDWDIADSYGTQITKDYMHYEAYHECGVKFLMPVSQYQMTMRTLKYGLLIIILTFVAFFITELSIKRSISVFQYFLVGLALVIFYSLLLSISEYLRFSYAFAIASAMTLGLVLLYLMSVLSAKKPALVIISLLALLYAFIYVLTQMETYSLIAGSVGLFVILAVIMFVSQRLFNSSTRRLADSHAPLADDIDPK